MKKIAGLVLTIAVLSQFSCSADPSIVPDNDDSLVLVSKEMKKQIVAEQEIEAINDQILEEILDEVLMDLEKYDFLKSESVCPLVTVVKPDSGRYPKVITRDFGEGCENQYGVERSGKIIVTLYGPWLKKGTVRIVEFEDYTRRSVAVEGKKKIVCLGLNEDSLNVHSVRGEIKLTRGDTLVINRDIHKKRTMLVGWGNPDVPKEWLISGHVKVSKSNGLNYIVNIPEPLYRIQGCRWAQSGIKVLHFNIDNEDVKPADKEDVKPSEKEGYKQPTDKEGYKHKVSIDYSYAESEEACDSYVLRWVNNEEPEVINLQK